MSILKTNDLGKTYRKGRIDIPALREVTFDMPQGELLALVGKSGSGKSTLLNLIGGLDRPSKGSILFEGRDLGGMSRQEMALHRRFSVGMIFQSFNLVTTRNALENVELALAFGGLPRRKRRQRAEELLEGVGLAGRLTHRPDELSGGETQRVAIARALANKPRMLLADEPTGNLDSETAGEIIALLRQLNREQELSVILVTHDLETAQAVAGRIIRLKDGRIEQITQNTPAP
jgi:ABC-type lipoprotein export system ATPase subunit